MAAGFQAETTSRREFGFSLISRTTLAIWSMEPPSPVGHERHCAP